ncbi:winged helix-turn-helix transcriptional regulator [Halobacteria archaeon AArc-dxtr1]|nr:winged helix-turn-helix transcriptional regulator [Halobacteria archaeon AArc-dxtr1]
MTQSPNPAQSTAKSILGTKWKPQLIVALSAKGRLGFGDCKRELEGISSKVLSNNLEALCEDGVVARDIVQERPRRVEYELTAAGRELYRILESMTEWDATYAAETGVPTVLLAEDDARLRELYALWLAGEYDVVTTGDGREGLRLLDEDVDAAVLDRTMPRLTGDEIARAVSMVGQRTPIAVLTSAQVDPTDASLPVDRLLRKPLSKTDLLDAVETLLGLPGASPVARDVQTRRHRLAFVERHLGSTAAETEPYQEAAAELARIESERAIESRRRQPWRQRVDGRSDDVAEKES